MQTAHNTLVQNWHGPIQYKDAGLVLICTGLSIVYTQYVVDPIQYKDAGLVLICTGLSIVYTQYVVDPIQYKDAGLVFLYRCVYTTL